VLSSVVFVLAHPRLPRAYFAKGQNRSISSPAPSAHAACPLALFTLLPPLALSREGSLEGSSEGMLPHHFPCTSLPRASRGKSFRMNTCESVSKQRTLTAFRMNTYEKHRGEGVLWLTRNPKRDFYPEGASRPRDLPRSRTLLAAGEPACRRQARKVTS
jgi:hypothetical protein